MSDHAVSFDPQLSDPSYNPTEPFRPFSLRAFVTRIAVAVCALWLAWEYAGAGYFCAVYQRDGLAAMQSERYQEATQEFSGMIRLKPDYSLSYQLRAQAYDQLGDYKAEIQDDTKAAATAGSAAARRDAIYARAQAEDSAKLYQSAIADYSICLPTFPSSTDARLGRANDYRRMGRYDIALADFDQLAQARPADPAVINGRDEVLRLAGNPR